MLTMECYTATRISESVINLEKSQNNAEELKNTKMYRFIMF